MSKCKGESHIRPLLPEKIIEAYLFFLLIGFSENRQKRISS